LLYNGILKDKAPKGGNVLTKAVLEDLPKHKGPKIIYGTACRLGKTFLKQREIVFRQIPYEIRVK
jgi:site-specific DNA-methyltransferase (adenine-specific)/adenine-specific DNA-methyltransferase